VAAELFLKEWTALTHELTTLVDTALDVEPAGASLPAWDAVRAKYGVRALGDEARLAEAKADRLTKGAPVSEVKACLDALVVLATRRLQPLRASLSAEQARLVETTLHDFTAQALAHYRAKATERKKRMFAAAKALAHQHQYGTHHGAQGYVLGCGTCHGPRLGEALHCAFCGGDLEVMS
jgi:transcriptional regulator of met regulon